jgi:cell division protein FtsB
LAKGIFEKTVKFLKLAFIFVALASIGFLMGIKGLNQKYKQEENRSLLQRENERLHVEIKSLERDLTLMRDSPQTIEKTAKRKLGMARPDETVYIFERRTPQATPNKDIELSVDKP